MQSIELNITLLKGRITIMIDTRVRVKQHNINENKSRVLVKSDITETLEIIQQPTGRMALRN